MLSIMYECECESENVLECLNEKTDCFDGLRTSGRVVRAGGGRCNRF